MPSMPARDYISFMEDFTCPYCGQHKSGGSKSEFSGCKFCGFKSAMIVSEGGNLLIVDHQMPYLRRRCQELAMQMPDVKVIVDRRIDQDPYGNDERRGDERGEPKIKFSSAADVFPVDFSETAG